MDAADGEDLLGYLQRSAREGTLLASCDRDVVEFMHQLDVLITAKQTQWERKEVALRDLLQARERDLSGLRLAIQEREKEVSTLKEAVSVSQRQNMDGQSVYAKQVDKLKAELQRLSHNYEKLRSKKRQTGGGRAGSSSGAASQEGHAKSSETTRLRDQRDLLELRLREVEGEKGRVDSHLVASRNEIAALQGRCLSLQEKLDSSQREREQLRREKQTAVEVHAQTTRELEEKLDQTLHLLDGRESLVRSLREEQEEAARQVEAGGVEVRQLNERVCSLQESLRRVERQRCDLRQQLKLKEESLQALTAENQKLSSSLLELEQNVHSSSEHCSRSLRGEEEEEGSKPPAEMRKECDRLRRKAVAYKQECSSLRAQLAAALVQGEVVRDNREVSPHLEQTVTELTAKLRSLEESWREEREKLLEENKRLEAVGQQRSQELQVAVQQVRQLERELDAVKKELAGTQKQLQVALKDGEQEVSCELRGSCATPSANPGTSGKTRHKTGAVLSTGGSSPQLREGRRSTGEREVPQDDTALLKTLDDILSKHFSQINTKLASTNDAT